MANRLRPEKASLIASEYISNGYKKTEALISCGYSDSYSKCNSTKLFDNVLVKQAIVKLTTNIRANSTITVQSIQSELEQLQAFATDKGDLAIAARCIELKGKTIAAFTDNLSTQDTTQQKAIDENAMLEAKRMAEIRLRQGQYAI